MFLLKTPSFEVKPVKRLIKAEELRAIADAEEVMAAAKAEAEDIRRAAAQEFELQKKRGYEQGLAEGQEEIIMQKMEMVESSVKYMEGMEGKMVDLVMMALKKCVEEIGDQEMVVQIIKKAMGAVVRNQQHITLRVAPAMVPTVRSRLNEIISAFPSLSYADVVEDSRLENMACVLESEAGIVDASIDTQLAAIEKSMRKQFNN